MNSRSYSTPATVYPPTMDDKSRYPKQHSGSAPAPLPAEAGTPSQALGAGTRRGTTPCRPLPCTARTQRVTHSGSRTPRVRSAVPRAGAARGPVQGQGCRTDRPRGPAEGPPAEPPAGQAGPAEAPRPQRSRRPSRSRVGAAPRCPQVSAATACLLRRAPTGGPEHRGYDRAVLGHRPQRSPAARPRRCPTCPSGAQPRPQPSLYLPRRSRRLLPGPGPQLEPPPLSPPATGAGAAGAATPRPRLRARRAPGPPEHRPPQPCRPPAPPAGHRHRHRPGSSARHGGDGRHWN